MDRISQGIIKHRKGVVAVFLAAALVCTCMIPFVKVNYDMADYLPASAQSTTAVDIMTTEFDQAIPNANVMVCDLSIPEALEVKAQLEAIEGVDSVMWLDDMVDLAEPLETLDSATVETYYHADGGIALFQVAVAESSEASTITAIRDYIDSLGDGNAVSGDAADTAQMQESIVTQVLMACAIVVPIIILLLVLSTMSWIEPILFLAAIGVSILINMGTNIVLGQVSFVTFSVAPILQLAVSLDYAIFLLHAFSAERKLGGTTEEAMARAMRRSTSTIAASALTTLFGFGALSFMQFEIGADLGINLVKGIVFSFITVVVLLPALTLCLYKLIDKSTHRAFLPSFENVGSGLAKVRVPALLLVIVLIVPCFLGQQNTVFTYQNSIPDTNIRSGADTAAVTEEFGQQNMVVVLVPVGDMASEAALSEDLLELDHVTSVMSYAYTVGATIPTEVAGEAATSQFYSDDWARIIVYVDTETEGDTAFALVQDIEDIAALYYDTYYTAGQSANLYDMSNIVAVDNVRVNLIAVIAIFIVVAITFRSLALPLFLVLTIETGIWINLAIPYFMGESVNFIGYLVINTVQLGATIDYGILLTTRYLEQRRTLQPREAMHKALGSAVMSLCVSAGILASAGVALSISSSISAVSSLGLLLARGALFSLILVTCFLPALLIYCDGFVRRTTWKADFAPKPARAAASAASAAPASAAAPAAADGEACAPASAATFADTPANQACASAAAPGSGSVSDNQGGRP